PILVQVDTHPDSPGSAGLLESEQSQPIPPPQASRWRPADFQPRNPSKHRDSVKHRRSPRVGTSMTMAELTRIDSRPVSGNRNEIRAFMVVWNDALRLASTLQHYRQLGVDRFFIVDCGSNDGTVEALEAAPDVHAFAGSGEGGIEWINTLLDRFGAGHWTLTVDADELFIYPHHEQLELPLFCRYLDYVGSQAVPCVSLDMYAASPIGDAVHKAGAPLLDTCRYFDAGPYRMVQKQDCPYIEIHG